MSGGVAIRRLFADRRMRCLTGLAAIGRWQDSMTILALLLAARAAGLDLAEASLASALLILSAGLTSTFKARWIDRQGMRRCIGCLALGTLVGYFCLILSLLAASLPLIILSVCLLGASRTNSGMCMQVTWLEVIKDKALRARAVSWENLVNTSMQSLGPLLLGLLVALWSPLLALVLCGTATSLSMFLWSRSSLHRELSPGLPADQPRPGLGWDVLVLAGIGLCVNFLMGALQVILVGGDNPTTTAFLVAMIALGTGAASLYAVARGFPFLACLSYSVVLGILGLIFVLPFAGILEAAALAPVLLLTGALFGLGNASITLIMQQRAPAGRRAEAFSWRMTLALVGLSAGQALAGQLIEAWGGEQAGIFFSGAGVLLLLYACFSMRLLPLPRLAPGFAAGLMSNHGLRTTFIPFAYGAA